VKDAVNTFIKGLNTADDVRMYHVANLTN